MPEGLSGRTPHWIGKVGIDEYDCPVLFNADKYDMLKEYAEVETPSETLRDYDVVFLTKELLPRHESDKDDVHIIKWYESAEKPTCMLAIVPKLGRNTRKERKKKNANGEK